MHLEKCLPHEAQFVSQAFSDRCERKPRYAAVRQKTFWRKAQDGPYEGADRGDGVITVPLPGGYLDYLLPIPHKDGGTMKTLADFENETWNEKGPDTGRTLVFRQIVGNSGVYLVIEDEETGEVIRDDRPWQMVAGVS